MDATITRVPVQTRSERLRSFDPEDFDAPSARAVNWRLTPLDRVAKLLVDEPTDSGAISWSGADAALPHGTAPRDSVFVPDDLPSAIAAKRSETALLVRIPAGEHREEPVLLHCHGEGAERHGTAHLVVEAGADSSATVVIRHDGSAQLSENVEIIVAENAALTLVTVQRWDDDAVHLSSHQARIERGGLLRHVVVSFGGGVVRINPSADLAGARSAAELFGLSFADAGQHFESQVYLYHHGPDTRGNVLYKGALQGVGARSVWVGDVLIGADARGTDSYEANRNLVLTDGARADSIPNLEIETGDIVGAGHASATGRFDDEQLFYLQARGIPEAEAKRLVVLGFLAEIAQKVEYAPLQDELVAAIETELAKGVI